VERTVVGIDVGSNKICALVGEVDDSYDLRIVGVGLVPSRGLRKGVVVNVAEATRAITAAVEEAERSSGYQIERAFVSVNGKHITSRNSHGVVAVSRREEGITVEDVDRVLDAAGAVSLAHNRELIHVIPRHYVVDGQEGVRDPVGMHGFRLEVEAHVATGSATAIQNLVKCVTGAGVEVDEISLVGLAAGHAVLAANERDMGVVLVDIGAGTTNIAIFIDGTVWHTVTLAIGGEYITSDISIGLRLPTETAEEVLVEHGHAWSVQVGPEERFTVESFGENAPLSVPRWKLAEIIEARVEEIFTMVGQEIKRSGYDGLLPAGVVISGGVAQLPGVSEVGREVLGLPVRVGKPRDLVGLVDRISDPAYAVSVGLMGWGLTADERRPLPKVGPSWGRRVLSWLRAFLPGQTSL
jgi:cell division protein FtsA